MIRTTILRHLREPASRHFLSPKLSALSVYQHRHVTSKAEDREAFQNVLGNTPVTNYPKPQFLDHKEVFKNKKTMELLRAYFVFSICSYEFLLKHHVRLLHSLRRIIGRTPFRWLMKATMYGQFMAGEKQDEVLKVSRRLVQSGLYPMFAYTAGETHGQALNDGPSDLSAVWTANFEALQEAIQMTAQSKEFAPVTPQLSAKLTSLADASLLQRVSEVITYNETVCSDTLLKTIENSPQVEKEARLKEATESLGNLLLQSSWPGFEIPLPMTSAFSDSEPFLPSLLTHIPFHLVASKSEDDHKWYLPDDCFLDQNPASQIARILPLRGVDMEDREPLLELWIRVLQLGQQAKSSGIKLVWDAEQSYLQPAIEALVLDSMRLLNTESTVIANTYQCYLKRTDKIAERDLQLSANEGFGLAAKVVRGAYMDEERTLAHVHSYEDPVNPHYEATTNQYYKVADTFMSRMRKYLDANLQDQLNVTFATHNADTVLYVLDGLQRRNLLSKDGSVRFAQLYGTRDYISYALGQSGYPAAKLLHFGDVEQGVAYLSRRVQENRAGVPTVSLERQMLQAELGRRLLRST